MMNRYGYGILIVMMLIVSACGANGGLGDGITASSTDMTADQATAFAQSISRISTRSMGAPAPAFKANTLSGANYQPISFAQINQQIAYTLTCTAGGNMKASGSITGSISDTGTGVILLDIPITITDWGCEPPLIINGDPYISITGTFSFLNGYPSTQQHLGIHGGFKSATQSCQVSLDTNFNTAGGGHTSGTVCGHSIDFTF